MYKRVAKVKFAGYPAFKDKGEWTIVYDDSDEGPVLLSMNDPQGEALRPEDIDTLSQISDLPGYLDPQAYAQVAGVTIGTWVLGFIIMAPFDDPGAGKEAIESVGVLAQTVENVGVDESLGQALDFLQTADKGPKPLVVVFTSLAMIGIPAGFAGYRFSRRRMRLHIRMNDGTTHILTAPEYVVSLLLGAWAGIQEGNVETVAEPEEVVPEEAVPTTGSEESPQPE